MTLINSLFYLQKKDYAERSVTAWYNEINLYDFDKCEFSHETVILINLFID